MTALAVVKAEIAAERSLAGVTRGAGLSARGWEMFDCGGRAHLPRLRRARGEFMAIGARQSFARAVIRVTEGVAISARVRAGRAIRFLIVTDAAGRDLASGVCATRGRVTRATVVVRVEVGGNRESGASIHGRVMATHAAGLRARGAGIVLGVIKLHVERFVEAREKILQRRIAALRVGVADQAHRYRRRGELSAMTIRAGFVAGKARRRGVVGAFVARRAGERAMTCTAVEELGVVSFGTLDHR